jgi:trk system potassium uptake protein TrkA
MRVIIVGCGRVGSQLANALSAERHDVVVIDRDPLSFRRLSREFGGRLLTGIGFDREILQRADIDDAAALAATTDSDNVNIVVAVTAKQTFKVPNVVARIYDPQAAEIYRHEGIPTVSPTLLAANLMKTMIAHPQLGALSAFGSGEAVMLQVETPKAMAGRAVQEFSLPGESLVSAIVRRGQAMIPAADARLEAGDILHIAAAVAAIPRLEKLLAH